MGCVFRICRGRRPGGRVEHSDCSYFMIAMDDQYVGSERISIDMCCAKMLVFISLVACENPCTKHVLTRLFPPNPQTSPNLV